VAAEAGTLIVVVLLSGCVACASIVRSATPIEIAGTFSPTGCDAWLEIGGRFSPGLDDITFTLMNRSTSSDCSARRVTLLFEFPVSHGALQVSTPAAWTATEIHCDTADGVCGVVWRAQNGVSIRQSQSGFGIVSTVSGLLKVWIVDVGRRRVSMPIGHVGG
jgi:hypothetical protein